jgi:hypothetical protein
MVFTRASLGGGPARGRLIATATVAVCLSLALAPDTGMGKSYSITIPNVGTVGVDIDHAEGGGGELHPSAPQVPEFVTAHVFAPPERCEPGVKARSLAGAFTGEADDLTAAVWNPAGLPLLGGPAAYVSGDWSLRRFRHDSSDADLTVSEDGFDTSGPDFIGALVPFRLLGRDWGFALSYHRAFDFTQRFTGDVSQSSRESRSRERTGTESDSFRAQANVPPFAVTVDSDVTTRRTSELKETFTSEARTSLQFSQDGVVDAVGPALGVALGPRCSAGVAVNVFADNLLNGRSIVSRTASSFSGRSDNSYTLKTTEETDGEYTYNATFGNIVFNGAGDYDMFSDHSEEHGRKTLLFEGEREEMNEYRNLRGANGTLGLLCRPADRLRLGGSLDLPWRARVVHERSVRQTVRTLDASGTRVLGVSATDEASTQDATLSFPLHAALGASWQWTDSLLSSLDVNHTRWSQFAYQDAAGAKINPLDGSAFGEHAIADCWGVACGAQAMLQAGGRAAVPLRCGLAWDQKPAIGAADEYWDLSVGSGVAVGKGDRRVSLDAGYTYRRGADVLGSLVPSHSGLRTTAVEHLAYVACSGAL